MGLNRIVRLTECTDEDISNFIRTKRKLYNLTQADVADVIKVNRKTYSNYELGKTYVPATVFLRLLKFYGYKLEIF